MVIGYIGGIYNFINKMCMVLSWVVVNYNVLNFNLIFSLLFFFSINVDIVVYCNFYNSGVGGVVGFFLGG